MVAETKTKIARRTSLSHPTYVVLSESRGVIAETSGLEQAEIAMIAYLRSLKPIEAELTAIYRRSESGLCRL